MQFFYKPMCRRDDNFAFPSYFHNFLKVNGFWPTDGDNKNDSFRICDKLYKCWNWFALSSVACLFFSEVGYSFKHITDLANAVENLCAAVTAGMVLIRMCHLRFAMDRMKSLLRIFADKIWIQEEAHPPIFDQCVRNMKPVQYIGISLSSAGFLYSILPIAVLLTSGQTLESPEKGLPYYMVFPYDHQKPLNYIFTYIWCIHAAYVIISQLYAMDAKFSLFVSFLCGQFDILHGRILRLIPECHAEWLNRYGDEGAVDDANLGHLHAMYTQHLHELIEHHNDLIGFGMELDKFFSFPLMVNFVTATFQIGFGGFQFLISGGNSIIDFLRFFLYLLSVTGQLYVICDLGNMLIIRSGDTARYLFMCNWEGGSISENSPLWVPCNVMPLDVLSNKLPLWRDINYYPVNDDLRLQLLFMILRSHRPVQLTAMKFAILSMESFSRILSSSLQYFALLKSFLDKQK